MQRLQRLIVLAATLAFTASTVGVPVAIYFCTMQGAYRTGECCCVCPTRTDARDASVSRRACTEVSDVGAPLRDGFTRSHVTLDDASTWLFAVLPAAVHDAPQCSGVVAIAHARDCSPPPLLASSVLLI